MEKITELQLKVFKFLNALRNSGATNMFGATPYITEEFPEVSKGEAIKLLSLWMNNFNEDPEHYVGLMLPPK